MFVVRLVYPEKWDNTFRLVPGFKSGASVTIDGVTFTTEKTDEADLAVIVNFHLMN